MGKSGFRVMLYKLRDFARKSTVDAHEPGNNKDIKIERTISLPRSGYYHQFAAAASSSLERGAGQGYESPGGPKQEKDDKIPKNKGKLLHSKSNRMGRRDKPQLCSTLIETRVSAGCSYRVAVAANARKSLLGKKKKVSKKNLQVIEMGKPHENPESKRSMENLRERNKDIILQSRKEEFSNCAAKVSFDGAVQEDRSGFESLRVQALNGNDNNNNNVERCLGGDGGFESRKGQNVVSNNSGRRCSAFCCSCRLSISESIDGLDESSLLDADIWSAEEEEEEKVEAQHLPTPFVRQSDRVVLDMQIDFSREDLLETNATLFRPSDVAGHAQVQAKLSQMIEEKGSKKKREKYSRLSNLTSNGKDSQRFPEFHANDDSDKSTLLPGAINDGEFNGGRRKCYARAKIDRQRASLRPKNGDKCRAATNSARSEGNINKISESVAIVKSSYDPRRDFRESMVEMIMENDIRDARDLKELLHCYIFLNSEEYHDVIFQVFEQVQSDLRIS